MTRVLSLRHARRKASRAACVCAEPAAFRPRLSRLLTPHALQNRVESLESRLLFSVYTVTTTADAGAGSLRQAILDANATPTIQDEIRFNILGTGVRTIRPLSPLPVVTGPTSIDARTQPGATTAPIVELDGSAAGPMADGIVFGPNSYGNLVRGLVINRFSRHGILTQSRDLTRVESNYIGTDAAGQTDLGNGGSGVAALGPVTVGGQRTAQTNPGNLISGNEFAGVWVNVPGKQGMQIHSNLIGTDVSGARAIGNGREGVLVEAGGVAIGRIANSFPASPNVISGNGASGIRISAAPVEPASSIAANFIGVDATGSRAVPNGTSDATPYRDGVTVEGASFIQVGGPAGSRNVISGNVGNGVSIRGGGQNLLVQGNYIGTDATGNADVGNGGHGVWAAPSNNTLNVNGNVISGNGGDGVHAEGTLYSTSIGVSVQGNYIGTNATATGGLGNDGDGVETVGLLRAVVGSRAPFAQILGTPLDPAATGRNIISANGGNGVAFSGPGFTSAGAVDFMVQGN